MSASAKALSILLVEDSPDDVFFFRRAVQKSGVAAVTHVANDGVEAIDYLSHQGRFADAAANPKPDVMFLDLKLPHVNGFEVLEWMKRHAECPHVDVIVLTSSNQASDREQAEGLGAALFLTKPPSADQLKELLAKFRPAA
jgi:CheY-like chemotaxis protein